MAENSAQEKTELPTPKRLQDAKKKGQVARSRELNTLVMMLTAALGMLLLGASMGGDLLDLVGSDFVIERREAFDTAAIFDALARNVVAALLMLAPFLVLMFVASLVGPVVMGGWSFSPSAMAPKLDKLDPLKGFARIFGVQALMELVKALGKSLLLFGVASYLLYLLFDRYVALGLFETRAGIVEALQLVAFVFLCLAVSLSLIAGIDVPFQKWNHMRKLKMTRQEVREEQKETDGNPEVKGKIRRIQQGMSERRMLVAVPDADVIITNPTHYAVALRYDESRGGAPVVLAKGVDHLAMKIREIAEAHAVPEFSAPPLARALYQHADIDAEIPGELYLAVAKVLAYIYRIRDYRRGQRWPDKPRDLDVPDAFQVPERS